MSFCCLIKGITPKIRILPFVLINSVLLNRQQQKKKTRSYNNYGLLLSLDHLSMESPDTVMHPALSKRMPMGGGVDCALYIRIHRGDFLLSSSALTAGVASTIRPAGTAVVGHSFTQRFKSSV